MVLKLQKMLLPNNREFPYIETGDPLGIPLIFLHGLGDSCRTFELLFQHFPNRIRAIAFTQRGHDGIDPPEASYRTQDFEADLLLFMNAEAIPKAFIIGASSGGFAARKFAATQAERTLGLILVGAPSALGDKPEIVEMHESTLSRLTDPVSLAFIKSFTEGLFTKPVPPDFLEMMFSESQKVPARVWKEASEALLKEKFPGQLHQVKVPALIVCGRQDTIASSKDQEKLASAITDARLTTFPQLGHMLYWEDPKNVAQEITFFVDDVWTGQESSARR
ncbi:alpha/beta hydrolase [Planococcus sp. ISL-109]|uniref:alpha/beta fold hydrolase n=1 Tax=Planococcus sp. ISL-109 TaxID=2819166 RepID=UPI001BE7D135|nr:alpha/beta hydrolase [Planococcus sp. ISL-109]MBT2582857.1 alpha/beta hydrolase [Planococcus sp. ISL-109]